MSHSHRPDSLNRCIRCGRQLVYIAALVDRAGYWRALPRRKA